MLGPESKFIGRFFDKKAIDFYKLYFGKNFLVRLWNKIIRPDIYERFNLTMIHSGDPKGKKVLDIGCGPGYYSIAMARAGVQKVLGLDLSCNMIQTAKELAKRAGLSEICEFEKMDVKDFCDNEKFDIVLAIGVFDYTEDPHGLLQKMADLCGDRMLVTFPAKSFLRSFIRQSRYKLSNCRIHFYDAEEIRSLAKEINYKDLYLIKIKGWGMDYFIRLNLKS